MTFETRPARIKVLAEVTRITVIGLVQKTILGLVKLPVSGVISEHNFPLHFEAGKPLTLRYYITPFQGIRCLAGQANDDLFMSY
jgi:hypothetical protein